MSIWQFINNFAVQTYFIFQKQPFSLQARYFCGVRISASLLLLILTIPFGLKTFFVFNYWIDPSRYEAQCENKARPEMSCAGKCQMAKKIAKAESAENPVPTPKSLKILQEQMIFTINEHLHLGYLPKLFCLSNIREARLDCCKGFASGIWRPPSIA